MYELPLARLADPAGAELVFIPTESVLSNPQFGPLIAQAEMDAGEMLVDDIDSFVDAWIC
jgi:hypothetical protein